MKLHVKIAVILILTVTLPLIASAKSATIKRVWLEHGVTINNKNAMKVHCEFTVSGMNGKQGNMNIWIKNDKGNWHNVNSSYKSTTGTPYFKWAFKPKYESANYSDFWFAPYTDDLNMFSGKHKYYVVVTISDENGKQLAQSNEIEFTGTGPTKSPAGNSSRNSNSNRNTNSNRSNGNEIVRQWTTPGPFNGTTEYTQYANGTLVSKTRNQCIHCHGSAVCGVCFGRGGTYNSYTQLYYPCGSCLQSGRCKYCNGTGYQEMVSKIDGNGNGYASANNNMSPVIISGGQVINGNSPSSSSSSSKRTTTKETKKTCPDCGGTRLWRGGTQPEYAMPITELLGKFHAAGTKCEYCGHYDKHWHSKCATCKHYSGTTNPYR